MRFLGVTTLGAARQAVMGRCWAGSGAFHRALLCLPGRFDLLARFAGGGLAIKRLVLATLVPPFSSLWAPGGFDLLARLAGGWPTGFLATRLAVGLMAGFGFGVLPLGVPVGLGLMVIRWVPFLSTLGGLGFLAMRLALIRAYLRIGITKPFLCAAERLFAFSWAADAYVVVQAAGWRHNVLCYLGCKSPHGQIGLCL